LVKHTSIPLLIRVASKLSAPFMGFLQWVYIALEE
jgi:hypothetical protein